MKVLRIKLTQSQASYTREETVNNRMTYPFPPYSTVIGAIHNSCGYSEYHPMDISVQGKYGSMQKEIYVNHGLLNRTEDDRGILIWMKNPDALSAGYVTVAEALTNGASFANEKLICVRDKELLEEYQLIKEKNKELDRVKKEEIKPEEQRLKSEKKKLKEQQKIFCKKDRGWQDLHLKIQEIDSETALLKQEFYEKKRREVEEPYSHFRTLTKGPQYQEVLYDTEWVIHVYAGEEVLRDIVEHKNDFVCLGRSEDFVEIVEMKICTLVNFVDEEYGLPDGYSMLVNLDRAKDDQIYQVWNIKDARDVGGTVYSVPKDYVIQGDKRIFHQINCLYSSAFYVDEDSENIYFDKDGGYIVDLN